MEIEIGQAGDTRERVDWEYGASRYMRVAQYAEASPHDIEMLTVDKPVSELVDIYRGASDAQRWLDEKRQELRNLQREIVTSLRAHADQLDPQVTAAAMTTTAYVSGEVGRRG